MNFRDKCFITGFVGDLLLQGISKQRGNIAGLRDYFQLHGSLESGFIAGGLMYFHGYLIEMSGYELSFINLGIYGILMDILYRDLNLMQSLDGYYKSMDRINSGIWGVIPFLMATKI